MAFVRFDKDCAVSLYFGGHFICYECHLRPIDAEGWRGNWESYSAEQTITHLDEHFQAGHIPEWKLNTAVFRVCLAVKQDGGGKDDTRLWPCNRHTKEWPQLETEIVS